MKRFHQYIKTVSKLSSGKKQNITHNNIEHSYYKHTLKYPG